MSINQLSDEIFNILRFCDHMQIIHTFSFINKFWCEKACEIPLSIRVKRSFKDEAEFKLFKCRFMIERLDVVHSKDGSERIIAWIVNQLHLSNNLKCLTLESFENAFESNGIDALNNFTNLKELKLHRNAPEFNRNIFQSGMLTHLTKFDLKGECNESLMKCLFENLGKDLRILNLGEAVNVNVLELSEEKFSHLEEFNVYGGIQIFKVAKLDNLKTLEVFCTDFDTSQICLPNLTNLSINMVPINPEKIQKLLDACPKVETLRAQDCLRGDTDIAIQRISSLEHLTYLDISINSISALSLKSLCYSSKCTKITALFLESCYDIGVEGCEYIGNGPALRNLQTLSLMYSEIGHEAFEKIVNSPNACNLTKLFVEGCCLDVESCNSIAESKYLTNLTELDISSNEIMDEGCQILCNTPNLQHLKSLIMVECEVTSHDLITNSPYLTRLEHYE